MSQSARLSLNDLDYLEMQGLNVMLAHDFYPDGHQGGVSIIQNGRRVATNGDLRLDRSPGQWSPVPATGERQVDRGREEISVRMSYPDPAKNRVGFNPIEYPDLELSYTVRVRPEEWEGRVGFMFELFPGYRFGKSYAMDGRFGTFPRQPNGPMHGNSSDGAEPGTDVGDEIDSLARGTELVIAPASDEQRMRITAGGAPLELLDGRGAHNNGWFIVGSLVPGGVTTEAVVWRVEPNAIPGWVSPPVVQVSQVGYHPDQPKFAIVELDRHVAQRLPVRIERIMPDGTRSTVKRETPPDWGRFLRYDYVRLDFTDVSEPGLYVVSYGESTSNPFRIAHDIFERHVWQPTLEYFLPAQMCHVRVNDARMAPVDHDHFDGYLQGPSTLCRFQPGDHVPGLNAGGWHDAGDHDLRVESQADTVYGLALAYEEFRVDYDNTTIDQDARVVEMLRPDGEPDLLQQVEHGCLSIVGGYDALGRLYRGIITPTLRQYSILGDPVNQSDGVPGNDDDRWVFTEENPRRELRVAAALAAASRRDRARASGRVRRARR